jgi:hypothetical protein
MSVVTHNLPGMVVHACNPSTRKLRQEDLRSQPVSKIQKKNTTSTVTHELLGVFALGLNFF